MLKVLMGSILMSIVVRMRIIRADSVQPISLVAN